ncbi:MAG: Ig-like domain-containing protein [Treponema sp.]|jgi:pectate lyase|nr:Ig-like domain-containing protein [Treponema sp.]
MKKIMPFLLFTALLLFSCQEPGGNPDILHWTFQGQIPGWLVYDPANTHDYPNGTTMNFDAVLPNGMTILASGRTTRWDPNQVAPSGSGFTNGYIQPNGATRHDLGRYSLRIENVQGPFKITLNYTSREVSDAAGHYPIIFINGTEVKSGEGASGFLPSTVSYDYPNNDIVTVQLGNAVGGIRIFDVIIFPEGSENNRILANSVTLNVNDFSLAQGDTRQLSANVLPGTATNRTVTWSSSNTNIATVNTSGLVTAVAAGSTTITATTKDGSNKSDSITVTVKTIGTMNTPAEIFETFRGMKATTNGWADLFNNGAGVTYTNPATLTLIDDATYPTPLAKRSAFTDAIDSTDPKFIIVSGDIDLSDGKITDGDKSYFAQFHPTSPFARVNGDINFNLRGNKTIIGIDNARLMFGGLIIRNGSSNIIIRNIVFWDAHGSTSHDTSRSGNIPGTSEPYSEAKASATALQVENNPGGSGLWVDHCKFTDGTCSDLVRNVNHDGAFDIKYGRFITVSWTEFTNHDKVMLVGSNDNTTGIITYLSPTERQITLHHNYFHNATQRMPRTRGTQMHIYNNYYNNIGNPQNGGSFMGPGLTAQFIVENNFFTAKVGIRNIEWQDTATYPAIVYYSGNESSSLPFYWGAINGGDHRPSAPAKPWIPGYNYQLRVATELPTTIPAGAGPKLFW